MPSGAGKSAIYQIAAVALGGPAVVVSPLLSLQRDQAVRLRAHGLAAISVNSAAGARRRAEAYAATRRETEAYADRLGVRSYHAGMRKTDRDETHRAFMRGETIVATSAFGMGVHRAGVRFVVHASVPGSLDEYYQEIGRAGRDGRPAAVVCCYRPEDLGLRRFFVGGLPDKAVLAQVVAAVDRPVSRRALAGRLGVPERRLTALLNLLAAAGAIRLRRRVEPVPDAPPPAEAAARARELAERHRSVERSRVEMMRRYAELTDCRRRFLLRYFGEAADEPCGRCDNCDAGRSTPANPGRSMFAPGARVEHRVWGKGTVLADEGERLIVFFDEVGYKELLTETVLTEHLLAPAADPAGSGAGPPPGADGEPE